MTNGEFLNWIADRLVHVYGESPNVDFVLKLREVAKRQDDARCVGLLIVPDEFVIDIRKSFRGRTNAPQVIGRSTYDESALRRVEE